MDKTESLLLDQTGFTVDAGTFARCQTLLDRPLPPTDRLRRLLKSKPPWEDGSWLRRVNALPEPITVGRSDHSGRNSAAKAIRVASCSPMPNSVASANFRIGSTMPSRAT